MIYFGLTKMKLTPLDGSVKNKMRCEECWYYTSDIYEDGSRSKLHCSWADDIPPCDDNRFWDSPNDFGETDEPEGW